MAYHQYCGKEQPEILRQVAYQVRNRHPKVVAVLGTVFEQKPNLIVALSDQVVQMNMNASQLVKIGAPRFRVVAVDNPIWRWQAVKMEKRSMKQFRL